MAEREPRRRELSPDEAEKLHKVEKEEDEEGIAGYGQPPKEVRTTHPEDAPMNDWGEPAGR
jgi:hypothetical protein